MSDASDELLLDDADDAADVPTPEPTGVEAVDEVVVAIEKLEGRPLEEHVSTFEQAHDVLRRTLDRPAASVSDAS